MAVMMVNTTMTVLTMMAVITMAVLIIMVLVVAVDITDQSIFQSFITAYQLKLPKSNMPKPLIMLP